ncbi:hypothetical protein HNR74_003946 [Flammeovirga kamogawensis]|nr:hypothetical protein [Flammeovirga kamogawensis]
MQASLKLLALFILISSNSFAQDLLNSTRRSHYSYIYQVTNDEVEKIYK